VGGNAGRSGRSHVMRSRLNRWVRSNLPSLLVALCGGVVVIVGPWLIPGSPTASQSYAMGFNNRVALVGVLLTIAVLLWIAWRRREDLPEERGPLFLASMGREERVPRGILFALLGLAAAATATLTVITYGDFGYGEMSYMLDRMAYLAAGFAPYRAFEFAYGPLMLYPPLWLHQLTGLPPQAAYLVVFMVWHLAGLCILYYAVNRLGIRRNEKIALLLALGLYLVVNENLGLSYSFTRSLMPLAALMFVHAWHTRSLSKSEAGRANGRSALGLWATASAAVVLSTLISPEVGIAAAAALVVYVGWESWRRRGRYLWTAIGFGAVLLAVFAVLQGTTGTLVVFASGGGDLPVLPGPPVLVYLVGAAIVAVTLPALFRLRPEDAPVLLGAAAVAFVMTPAVLSRADSGHVIMNSLAVTFLAALALSRRSSRAAMSYIAIVGVVFIAAHAFLFTAYLPALQAQARRMATGTSAPASVDVSTLATCAPIAAPFGFVDETGYALAQRGLLAPVFYRQPVVSPAQLAADEASLDHANAVLAESSAQLVATPRAPRSIDLRPLEMFPLYLRSRGKIESFASELNAYIDANFGQARQVGPYILLVRKSGTVAK